MSPGSLERVKPDDRKRRHYQLIRNALACLNGISTDDKALAGHLLEAEQALRKASAALREGK